MTFHLLASYSLIAANRAALYSTYSAFYYTGYLGKLPRPRRNQRNACPVSILAFEPDVVLQHRLRGCTLYQCFFTLPSVRLGKVFGSSAYQSCRLKLPTSSYLRDLSPAAPLVSHCFQSLFLRWAPGSICSAFLGRWHWRHCVCKRITLLHHACRTPEID